MIAPGVMVVLVIAIVRRIKATMIKDIAFFWLDIGLIPEEAFPHKARKVLGDNMKNGPPLSSRLHVILLGFGWIELFNKHPGLSFTVEGTATDTRKNKSARHVICRSNLCEFFFGKILCELCHHRKGTSDIMGAAALVNRYTGMGGMFVSASALMISMISDNWNLAPNHKSNPNL